MTTKPRSLGDAVPPRPMTRQLSTGITAFAGLIRYWRGRSQLSGAQMVAIAAWAIGEPTWLDTAVLSRIETNKLTRGCSLKNLLAFDAANCAIHLWHTKGKEATWARFGPHSSWGVKDEWLDGAIWLPVPDQPDHPMEFADFAEVLVGRLEPPYAAEVILSGDNAEAMSNRLSDLLNAAIAERALPPRDAVKAMLAAYPAKDQGRRDRLVAVVMGNDWLSREELESELFALAETLRELRGLKLGSYGPSQLAQELSAGLSSSE